MLASLGGLTLSMAWLAYLHVMQAALLPFRYLALLMFSVSYSFGLGLASFLYPSEILPSHLRAKGVALGNMIAKAFGTVFLTVFPIAVLYIRYRGVWLFFACVNIVGFAFVLFNAPESSGVSLEEAQGLFGEKTTSERTP